MHVCLDAGHGGRDSGAVNGTRLEKDDSLKMTLAVGHILMARGVKISYTRTIDVYDSPTEKAGKANASGADFFVSFHRNSAESTASGTEVLVYNNNGKKAEIAKDLCLKYKNAGFTNRGVKERPNLVVLNATTMPAILIELGFISSVGDNELLDSKFDQLAELTAEGIIAFWGNNLKPTEEQQGWIANGSSWEYWQNGTIVKNDWIFDDGFWYWLGEDGKRYAGWLSYKSRWYYLDPSGKMQIGMTNISETWYYFNSGQLGNNTDYGALMKTDTDGGLSILLSE